MDAWLRVYKQGLNQCHRDIASESDPDNALGSTVHKKAVFVRVSCIHLVIFYAKDSCLCILYENAVMLKAGDSMYYNYHAQAKRLIREGHLSHYEIVDRWNHITPALVLYFDNHHPMPIREERWSEYLRLL